MGGGGKSKSKEVQAPVFDTSGYTNTGYNATPNPFTSQGRPNWMQGNFAMDSWGKSAADPRISLTQDMLNPYGAPIHNAAVQQMGQYDQQMAQGLNPQMPAWMSQLGGQPISLEQAMAMNARPTANPLLAIAPRAGKAAADPNAAPITQGPTG